MTYHVGVTITYYRAGLALGKVYIPPRETSVTREAVTDKLPAIYCDDIHRELIAEREYNPYASGRSGQIYKITVDLNFAIAVTPDEGAAIVMDWQRLDAERKAYEDRIKAERAEREAERQRVRANRWYRRAWRWALGYQHVG